jgi:hypothetical protein
MAAVGRLTAGLLGMSFALALPAAAQANNLFTLDSQADSTGPIVTDSSGTAYVAWNRTASSASQADAPMFCKIPRGGTCTDSIALPLPPSSEPSYEGVVQPFPVLGTQPGVVYVVGPRYIRSDNLIWSSTDGGATFSLKKPQGTFAGDTNVGDVLLAPGGSITTEPSGPYETNNMFEIASDNVGVGYSFTGNNVEHVADSSFSFNEPGSFTGGSTLGLINNSETSGVVEAYYTDTTPVQIRTYVDPTEGLATKQSAGWSAHPETVTDGYEPRLASGPDGLFLLSTDLASGAPAEEQPSVIDVRKYNESTHTFDAPTTIANIPTSAGTLFTSGDIYENPETGVLYVVQPVIDSEGAYVMRLWESSNGGESFTGERNIATIGFAYSGIPRLAVAADGQGWLTFEDAGGLEVADLSALPKSAGSSGSGSSGSSGGSPLPPPPPPPPAKAVIAANKFGDLLVQLIAPTACTVASSDLSLTVQSLPQSGKGLTDYTVDHVAFYVNGGLKTKITVGKPPHRHHKTVHEPQYESSGLPSTFTFLPSKIGAHAGSNSVLVKITLVTHKGKGKHRVTVRITKTLHSSFDVC